MRVTKLCLVLSLFVLLSYIALADPVGRSPRPELLAVFNEPVQVLMANITDSSSTVSAIVTGSNANRTSFRFKPLQNLGEGNYTFNLLAIDDAGNIGLTVQRFRVNLSFSITLVQPPYGVSSTPIFDIVLQSNLDATCRYGDDPTQNFANYPFGFDETGGKRHVIAGYDIANGATIYVNCNASRVTGPTAFSFLVDPTPPVISRYDALPNPVAQNTQIDNSTFVPMTLVRVDTDDETQCRLSRTATTFDQMEISFPEDFASVHRLNLSLPGEGTFSYHAICQNRALLQTPLTDLVIVVNTRLPLEVNFNEIVATRNTTVVLEAVTNKDAMCTFTNASGSFILATPQGSTHRAVVSGLRAGSYTYNINCSRFHDTAQDSMTFIVDLTPPTVLVNDTSDDAAYPDRTWRRDRLRVRWTATDNETDITSARYQLEESGGGVITSWTIADPGSDWLWVERDTNGHDLNLTNGHRYFFKVNVTNAAALFAVGQSDGITIDTNLTPPDVPTCHDHRQNQGESDVDCGGPCPACDNGDKCGDNTDCVSEFCDPQNDTCAVNICRNNETDTDETDVDCGGPCPKCADAKRCDTNADCLNGFCNPQHRCATPSCTDGVKSPLETDVDCGGHCLGCDIGKSCVENADCDSLYCKDELCAVSSCTDAVLNGGESDVDCGGPCPKCTDGKQCAGNADNCASGLCPDGVCGGGELDTDHDGMPDSWEIAHGLNPNVNDAADDPDHDTLTNLQEYQNGFDPHLADTDGDGIPDNVELYGREKGKPSILGILALVLLVLALVGTVGYYVYTKYGRKPKGPQQSSRFMSANFPRFMRPAMPPPRPYHKPPTVDRSKAFSAFDAGAKKEGPIPLKEKDEKPEMKGVGEKKEEKPTEASKEPSKPAEYEDEWVEIARRKRKPHVKKEDVFTKVQSFTKEHKNLTKAQKAEAKKRSTETFDKLKRIGKKP